MLFGETIVLRSLRKDDIPKVNLWRNNLDLTKLTMGIRFPISIELDEDWFNAILRDKSNRNLYWAITVKETEELIGLASLREIDYISGTCKFGRMIGDENHRGLGYGKETEEMIREYAFNVLNLRKITRQVVDYNQRSLTLLKNQGLALEEGRLKKHFYMDGKYHDVVILSIFRDS